MSYSCTPAAGSARTVCVLVLVAGALFALGCHRSVPLQATTPVLLASQASPEDLRAAIIRALDGRRFVTEGEEPGRIVARYQRGATSLRLALDYSPTEYRITYLDSTGLEHTRAPDGAEMISSRYAGWVNRLRNTIDAEMGRPAREAQEAAERQRQHELAVLEEQRQREQQARDAEAREHDRERQAQLARERQATERERLRTERAQAEADARRPLIVGNDGTMVGALAFSRGRSRGRFRAVRLRPGFGERAEAGRTDGAVSADELALPEGCRGWYSGQADHVIQVRRELDHLEIQTDGDGDPTLAIVASDGNVYCDDDGGEGFNAKIAGRFPEGTYRVFVGSYERGASERYELVLSEGARATVVYAASSRGATRTASCEQMVIDAGYGSGATIHCGSAEPRCASAVLGAGFGPGALVHCQGVDGRCAERRLASGDGPGALAHCR